MAPEDNTSQTTQIAIDEAMAALTPEDLEFLAEQQKRMELEAKNRRDKILSDVASQIEAKFRKRVGTRAVKERQWLFSMRLYLGSNANKMETYSPDKPFQYQTSTRAPEFNIVRTKCDIAIAQSISMQFAGGEKNWDIVGSPDPRGPDGQPVDPAMVDGAAERMERAIDDALINCDYGFHSRAAIRDRIILGVGILKGPMNTLNLHKKYRNLQSSSGRAVPQAVLETVNRPSVIRVNPWFFFPDDSVVDIKDAEDSIEAHPMGKNKLASLLNSQGTGFSDFADEIKELLEAGPSEFNSETFTQFTALTDTSNAYRNKYCVLEYHGPVEKTLLDELNIEPSFESPNEVYYGEIWVCQGKVINVKLSIIDGCYEVPYAMCTWEADPSSVFGIGVPMLVADQQLVINETYRMLLDNASRSSGPQVIIDKEKITPAGNTGSPSDWELRPDKVWYKNEYGEGKSSAFEFFEVPNISPQLAEIINIARGFAEEESGVPLLQAGLNSPGVVQNATGAQLMNQAATVVLDYKNEAWDDCVTEKVIRWVHDWMWEYNPDESIKADYEIDVKSSSEFRNKQIHVGNLEKLSVAAAQNPALGEMLNMQNVAKAQLSLMQLPNTEIVKSDEQIKQEQEARAQQPDPEMIKLQLEQRKLELEAQKMELEMQKLQFELQQQQQRELWEHEEKMGANYARIQEAQAQVISTEQQRELELIKLAASSEEHRQQILADLAKEGIKDKRDKFLAGLDFSLQLRDRMLQKEELQLAKKNGGGALSTV